MNIEEKWSISKDEMQFMKVFCIHGFRVSKAIPFALRYKNDVIDVTFISYKEFVANYNETDFINTADLVKCDTIAIIRTCNNNTLEMQILKISITVLFFAERLKHSSKRIPKYPNTCYYIENYHDYFSNYLFDGYWTENGIYSVSWYIGIGKHALHEDDFERWTTRIYGISLVDSYERRARIPQLDIPHIDLDNILIESIRSIMLKVNSDYEYGKKLRSAFRLYYEVLCNFKNPDYTVIIFCTIFETLLLKNDEDSQRKKVAVRAACITCDNLDFKYKRFVADQVYHFYKYRNAIIHDGKGLLDFDNELLFNNTLFRIKHIVFCIIKCIVLHDIKKHNELMEIVKKNVQNDGLDQAYEYIDLAKFENPDYIMPFNIT